jgi:nucleotide-binding universal stress UspA family protein
MLENILVPLDGSPVGEAAMPFAVALASRSGAKLTLVRTVHASALTPDRDAAQLRAVSEAEMYLHLRAGELRVQGFQVDTGVPYGTTAADWIVEEVGLRHADMIVMGTHDRVGPDRWLHGSVAEAVVSRAAVPVMLIRAADGVRPVEQFDWREPVLVVPLDGSELAEAALPAAITLGLALNGHVVCVGVLPPPGRLVASHGGAVPYPEEAHAAQAAEARDYLETVVDRLRGAGLPAEFLVRTGDPAPEIAQVALKRNAGAVVMATHGRTGPVRAVVGSVAGQVVHVSTSPVLLVRPPQLRAAEEPLPAWSTAVVGT